MPRRSTPAHLGSLFTPSPAEIETDAASTLSTTTTTSSSSLSSSSFEVDSSTSAAAAAAVESPQLTERAHKKFHTTPIPRGALVLLGSANTHLASSPPKNTPAPNDMALNRRNVTPAPQLPAGARTTATTTTSGGRGVGGGRRETKVWAGPKGKMPLLQRWKVWYGGVSVIEMLETWETVLYHSIILVALFAVFCALAYLPAHVSTMIKRAQWYISGVDDVVVVASA
ncbi:hypothetical protein JCM3774_000684 [Rhodotorula dairenensis]